MNESPATLHEVAQSWPIFKHLGLLAVIGAVVGLGQVLAEQGKVTPKAALGRCLSSGAMGVCAGAALTWFPDLPLAAECGLAAIMASLGTSGLTALFQKFLTK